MFTQQCLNKCEVDKNWRRVLFVFAFLLFVPEDKSCSLILQPWPLAISFSHTQTHTYTQCVAQIKAQKPPQTPPNSKFVSGFPHRASLCCSSQLVCVYPVSCIWTSSIPKCLMCCLTMFPLFQIHIFLCPCEICAAGFSFFLLSTQLSNPGERKRSSWFDTTGGKDRWMERGKG